MSLSLLAVSVSCDFEGGKTCNWQLGSPDDSRSKRSVNYKWEVVQASNMATHDYVPKQDHTKVITS